jgi:hypothetical protein
MAQQIDKKFLDPSLIQDLSDLEVRVGNLETFTFDEVLYVSKNGSDDNSGAQHSPFLTITAAQNATDASPSKRYIIKIAPGSYSEASILLKANVFLVGEGNKEAVRITGPVSLDSSFSGGGDHRSGLLRVTLLSVADFDWSAVSSAAGKLYMSETVFGSTVNMYGHDNATAQAQFNSCIFFGNLTISGINVGVFTSNVSFANITLNQHPNGGMASLLVATGGYCAGTITLSAATDNFGRRSAAFLRSFLSENLIINGPSAYADVDLVSQSKQGAQTLNGGNLVALNPKINHSLTTQMLVPNNTNAHNLGDWGKQWMWNFGYVHASTGTDLFLISYPSSFAPADEGKSIGIFTDGAGLQNDVDGGNITLSTATTEGTGIRGAIVLNAREIDVTSKQIKNLAPATDPNDAVNKSQLEAAISENTSVSYAKESMVITEQMVEDGFVDLQFEAAPSSIMLFAGRVALIEDLDYEVSNADDITRITFLAPIIAPASEALIVGDRLHFTYAKAN